MGVELEELLKLNLAQLTDAKQLYTKKFSETIESYSKAKNKNERKAILMMENYYAAFISVICLRQIELLKKELV